MDAMGDARFRVVRVSDRDAQTAHLPSIRPDRSYTRYC
jgi:hypothetical protein